MPPLPALLLCLTVLNLHADEPAKPAPPAGGKEQHAFAQVALQPADGRGHTFIRGTVDGRDVVFLLDSGYSQPLVASKQLAEQLGKTISEDPSAVASGIDGDMKTYRATFDSLVLGQRFAVKKATLRVMDLSHVGNILVGGKPQRVDGLVGSQFLKSVRAVYDPGKPALLVPQGSPPQGIYQRSRQQAGDIICQLKEGRGGFPFITVKLKDKEFAFLVDTGCVPNVMQPAVAKELGLAPEQTSARATGPKGEKKEALSKVTVEHPTLGGVGMASLEFHLVPSPAGDFVPPGMTYGGIIGSAQITNMKTVLDFDSYSLIIPKALTKKK